MSQPFRTLAVLGLVLRLGYGSVATGELTIDGSDGSGTVISDEAESAEDLATANLAGRLGVDASDIAVAGVEAQTWSDTSLDCPEPDRLYAQVLVDGFRIVLRMGDDTYEYHSGQGRVVWCGSRAA